MKALELAENPASAARPRSRPAAGRRHLRVARDLQLACQFEPLESRTLMSAAPLTAPSGLTASTAHDTVQLQWQSSAAPAKGYEILRSTDGAPYSKLATLKPITAHSYQDTTTQSGNVYSYMVESFKGAKTSPASDVVSALMPLTPVSNLTASATTPTAVQLNWQDNDASAIRYNVLRSSDGSDFTKIAKVKPGSATSYLDTTALSGQSYEYEVKAVNAAMTSAASAPASVVTTLAAPTSLSAALSGSSINLTWTDNDSSATGYNVLRSTDNVHFTPIATLNDAAANSYTDSTVASGTAYSYEVQAINTNATSVASNIASATTPAPTNLIIHVPATKSIVPVSGLTVSATGPATVQLNWTDNDTTATGYSILRSTDGVHFASIATVNSASATSYTDASALPAHENEYEVQAFNSSTTAAASPAAGTYTSPIAIASGLTASVISPTSVQLTWTEINNSATGIYILRSTSGAAFTQIATLNSGSTNNYLDATVLSGNSYAYEVQPFNSATTASASNSASAITPLLAPTGLAAALSGSSISLTWTDNDNNATGYYILRSTDNVHFSTLATLTSPTAAAYTDSTTSSGTAYSYEVQAFNAVTTSPLSAAASATTPLAAVSALSASATSPTSVQLTWTNNDADASGYYALRSTDNINYNTIATLTSPNAAAFTDSTAASGACYSYEVQAFDAATAAAPSVAAPVTMPLAAVSGLSASATTPTSVQLTWTDNDPDATGYYVLRSTDNIHFNTLATLTSVTVATYTDSTAVTGTNYSYEVEAFNSMTTAPACAAAPVTTPLAGVSGLTAWATSNTSVQLSWTLNDTTATGYYVLRSTDGVHFNSVTKVTSTVSSEYIDASVPSGHSVEYEVETYNAVTTSAPTAPAAVITPLAAPSSLAATLSGSSINLTWTDNDSSATGYYVLRCTDNVHFAPIATLSGAATAAYTDTTTAPSTTYYYQVQAFNTVTTSPVSATVIRGTAASGVTLSTRYGDELVITAAGSADSVSVSETGSTLSINSDGSIVTDPVPAAGVFVYTRGGADAITIASSVTADVTLETIDGAATTINSAGSDVSAWIDSTDVYTGTGAIHRVAAFAGGVSKGIGAALANPTDSGSTTVFHASLFGTGPVAGDVNQGEAGDCYFLASLAAFAGQSPSTLTQSAVDMGDGTYTVQFLSGATPEFVRVSNALPAGPFSGYMFAHPGSTGSIWAPIMEKAFCYFRSGANTYASISSGWMGEVYSDFGVGSMTLDFYGYSDASLFNMLSSDLAAGDEVTMGTPNSPPNLVGDHAYTLVSAYRDSGGIAHYVVRNPWGSSGDSLENSQGYATLTYAQFTANFVDGCAS